MAIVEVNGTRIAYDRYGEGASGPTIVFLHAFPLNRIMWEPQIEALRGPFDVIAPDMRGHGASDVTEGRVSMEMMADDVQALVTSLDLGPVVLVGLSMGGYVSLEFARKYPESLRALVLADTRATADTDEAREGRYKMIEEVAANGPIVVSEAMLPKLLSEETAEKDAALVASVRRMIETTSPVGLVGAIAGMAERQDSTAVLPTIAVPTLVIVGDEDKVTTRSDADAMASAIPGARLEVVNGAAHLTNLEQPDYFTTLLREFLNGQPA